MEDTPHHNPKSHSSYKRRNRSKRKRPQSGSQTDSGTSSSRAKTAASGKGENGHNGPPNGAGGDGGHILGNFPRYYDFHPAAPRCEYRILSHVIYITIISDECCGVEANGRFELMKPSACLPIARADPLVFKMYTLDTERPLLTHHSLCTVQPLLVCPEALDVIFGTAVQARRAFVMADLGCNDGKEDPRDTPLAPF
jgi:hypothetical protein